MKNELKQKPSDLMESLLEAITNATSWATKMAISEDTVDCVWEGQTPDGRKRKGASGKRAFPFEGASDLRVLLVKNFEMIDLEKGKNLVFYGVDDRRVVSVVVDDRASDVYLVKAQVIPEICDFLGLIPIVSTVVISKYEMDLLVHPSSLVDISVERAVSNLLVESGLDRLYSFAKERESLIIWDGRLGKYRDLYFVIDDMNADSTYDAFWGIKGSCERERIGSFCDIEVAKAYCERYFKNVPMFRFR